MGSSSIGFMIMNRILVVLGMGYVVRPEKLLIPLKKVMITNNIHIRNIEAIVA
jgi:hypothetical protein